MRQSIGIIFDMDGVLVNNHFFHFSAWQKFAANYNIDLDEEYYKKNMNGRTATDVIQNLFDNKASAEEVEKYTEEKETIYRDIYKKHIKPAPGTIKLLEELKEHHIPCAVATSAPTENVVYTMDLTGLREFFDVIVDATGITHGKPNPEIYLKAAEKIKMNPENCIVFEDAISGIEAGKRAGATVIAIATTHTSEELVDQTPYVFDDFTDLSFTKLVEILKRNH